MYPVMAPGNRHGGLWLAGAVAFVFLVWFAAGYVALFNAGYVPAVVVVLAAAGAYCAYRCGASMS